MKFLLFLFLVGYSVNNYAQLKELNPFVKKVVDIFFQKNTDELKALIASEEDLSKLKEELLLDQEAIRSYTKELINTDLFSDEEFYWEVLEDEVFYKENEVIKNLDLEKYQILYTEITECAFSENGLFEVYLTIVIESNGQYLQYELGELIYTKEKGYQFVEEPYFELLSEDIWDASTGFNLTSSNFKLEADTYVKMYFSRDSVALEKNKEIERKYLPAEKKQRDAAMEIKRFWKYLKEYGFSDSKVQSIELIHSIGSEIYDEGKLEGVGVLSYYKLNNYLVFFEVSGSFFGDKQLNIDYVDLISVVKLF